MYNAASRIAHSIIDNDLFSNSLAWGVNIDGFNYDTQNNRVISIYEKRICTYNLSELSLVDIIQPLMIFLINSL